ncbi:hypothetical protein KUTeg_003144 [Tegillarca granosa]|uniref:Uncharacterized protein n=1 Tax=Tegillarca granosa TaxID=220873 RepID=A0ABQ9FL97_TEGGR|nr:hypothetical protein KUTeg_003144 [Tegillarca granosa]
MKENINVRLMFLDLYNGNAQLGCAAVLETHWCFMRWPFPWHNKPILKDITFLELVPISLAFNIWSSN